MELQKRQEKSNLEESLIDCVEGATVGLGGAAAWPFSARAAGRSRPGGNLTGMLSFEASITGKWLAMLKEIAPGLARVVLLSFAPCMD